MARGHAYMRALTRSARGVPSLGGAGPAHFNQRTGQELTTAAPINRGHHGGPDRGCFHLLTAHGMSTMLVQEAVESLKR